MNNQFTLHKHENSSQEEIDAREFLKLLNIINHFLDKDAEIVKDELSSLPKVEESSSDPQT